MHSVGLKEVLEALTQGEATVGICVTGTEKELSWIRGSNVGVRETKEPREEDREEEFLL